MNPNQKSGNFKKKKTFRKNKPQDKKMHKIARQEVNKMVLKKAESKTYDATQTPTGVGWNGGPINVLASGITQGAGNSQRIGREIDPTHLRIKGSFLVGAQTCVVRLIVINTKQSNTPIGSYGELLTNPTSLESPYGMYKVEHSSEYKVLFDEFYCLIIGTESSRLTFDIRITSDKLKRKLTYDDAGAISTGGLYLYAISDRDPTTPGNIPTINYVSRLYYKDF